MRKCKHTLTHQYVLNREVFVDGRWRMMVWMQCDCGAWLSLGPARDDERTAIEVRAIELADIASVDAYFHGLITIRELDGWRDDEWVRANDAEFDAGCLARAIATHPDGDQ